jgi:hypothetical protein
LWVALCCAEMLAPFAGGSNVCLERQKFILDSMDWLYDGGANGVFSNGVRQGMPPQLPGKPTVRTLMCSGNEGCVHLAQSCSGLMRLQRLCERRR